MNNCITIDPDFIETLFTFHWFENCGKDIELENVLVTKDIRKAISSTRWENIVLEECGKFTTQLSKNFKDEYRCWNQLIKMIKSEIFPRLERIWRTNLETYDILESYILDDIKYNVLMIIAIHAYHSYIPMPDFFKILLSIYANGHIPCGWKKDKGIGKIIVY